MRSVAAGFDMFKFAFALGIVAEWVTGPVVASAPALATAAIRALMATLLAWMALEAVRAVLRAVQTLDDQAAPDARSHGR